MKYFKEKAFNISNFDSYKSKIKLSDTQADNLSYKLLNSASKSDELFIILEIENELYLEPIIDQLFIQEIANKDREFVIGDKIYKYKRDIIRVGKISELGEISWNQSERQNIYREYSDGSRLDLFQCNSASYSFSGFTRRVSGEVSKVCAYAYSEVKVSSKHRRKSWTGAWTYSDVPQMRMGDAALQQTTASFKNGCNPDNQCVANPFLLFTEDNATAIHHLLAIAFACLTCPDHCNTNLNYSATCLDNVNRGCSIVN